MREWFARQKAVVISAAVAIVVIAGVLVVVAGGDDDDSGDVGAGGGAVASETLRVGVALPDLEAFARLSKNFDIGDAQQQMEAILDGWRRNEVLPIHGRDLEFVYRKFSILGSDEQIAACNGFAKDDNVSMVIATRSFEAGGGCLADRFQIPILEMGTNIIDRDYEQRDPYQITVRTSMSRQARNLPHFAEEHGLLEGRTIGLYSFDDAITNDMVENFQSELGELGQEVAVHVKTESTLPSPQDEVAVQRFRDADVDLAVMFVGTVPLSNFLRTAEGQGYNPDFIDLDYGDHTADASAGTFPAAVYDGALAMTQTRTGQVTGTGELTEKAEDCLSNYERFAGTEISREPPESAELANILQVCDIAEVFRLGLEGAGEELTAESFAAGVESIDDLELAAHGNASYGPGRHYGVEEFRTIEYQADCGCWSAVGDFRPYFVP